MKKILIVNSYYAPTIVGGAEISTQLLAEDLTKYYKVCVLTTGSHRIGIKREENNGVEIYRIPCLNLYWPVGNNSKSNLIKLGWHLINVFNPFQYILLKKIVKEINPDIIHTQNLNGIGTYIWKIAKNLKLTTIHTTRDYTLFNPVKNSYVNKLLANIHKRRSNNYVDRVVGISRFILDQHREKGFFQYSQDSIIHNVVNSKRYQRKERYEGDPLIIGYFGQIEEIKGIDKLVDTISKMDKNIVQKLIICGTGSLEEELKAKFCSDERIIFRGKIPLADVNKQMANVDLTVVPSVWEEPFGRVIIESYNQGTPVIATNVGGIKEIVQEPKYLINKINQLGIQEAIFNFQEYNNIEIKEAINDSLRKSEKYKQNVSLYIQDYEENLNKYI